MRFAFRVDSSPEIGLGHLMRCLTLANGLRDFGFECYFICRNFEQNNTYHVLESDFPLELLSLDGKVQASTWLGAPVEADVSDCLAVLKQRPVDWLIVDHYCIDQEWSSSVRQALPELKIMVIDDLVDRKHDCDLLLDQTYQRERSEYQSLIPEHAKFCGGSDYALLRPSFLEAKKAFELKPKDEIKAPHILVTLGGGDIAEPLKVIIKSLTELLQNHSFSVTAIVGNTSDAILEPLKALPCHVELITFSNEMAPEMLKADFAIGAAGGTSWERCCVGLPTVVLTLADNQIELAKILNDTKAGISVKTEVADIVEAVKKLLSDPTLLQEMSENSTKLCDGKGVTKLIRAIISENLVFREVEMSDAKFIYDARYADGASRFYRTKEEPDFESHVAWLKQAIQDKERLLIIISLCGEDIAHLRFDRNKENALHGQIGFCVSPEWRGKRIGAPSVIAFNKYFKNLGILRGEAEIHEDNVGSWVIFSHGGYKHVSTDSNGFMLYVWEG